MFNLNEDTSSGVDSSGNDIYIGDMINLGGSGLSGSGSIAFANANEPTYYGDYRLIGGTLGSPNLNNFILPTPSYYTGVQYSLSRTADPGYIDLIVAAAAYLQRHFDLDLAHQRQLGQ